MISCDEALMYDGPAFDWHGMVPLVPFYLDEWAWEPSGYSLFNGTANTQDAIDDLIRSIYRVAMARADHRHADLRRRLRKSDAPSDRRYADLALAREAAFHAALTQAGMDGLALATDEDLALAMRHFSAGVNATPAACSPSACSTPTASMRQCWQCSTIWYGKAS